MEQPRVALMQPAFLPWQGFFGLVAAADVFVLLDDFQFVRRSFHHRNRILQSGAETWVTVPVAHARGSERVTLGRAFTSVDGEWRRRFAATLDHAYGRAAFHAEVREPVDRWLHTPWPSLAEMNIAFIRLVARMLGFTPEWRRSSDIGSSGQRSERILDLLRRSGARTYLSARGSHEYMVEDAVFPVRDIDVAFQDFVPQPYPQRRRESFVSHLSVLDALFEVGPAATSRLVRAGQRDWTPWRAMPAMSVATRAAP